MIENANRQATKSGLLLAAVAAIYVSIYARTLGYGFFDDDFNLVSLGWNDVFDTNRLTIHLRPIWYLSYVVVSDLSGTSALAHHLTNHLVHLANCVLAFCLMRRWLCT